MESKDREADLNGQAEGREEEEIGRDTKLLIMVETGDFTYISILFEIVFNKHAVLLQF